MSERLLKDLEIQMDADTLVWDNVKKECILPVCIGNSQYRLQILWFVRVLGASGCGCPQDIK